MAGVYAVAQNETFNSDANTTSTPSIASIDLMQANIGGFGVAAHPCSNGSCDAISQCSYSMAVEGKAKYGVGSYGTGGNLIDTDREFTVRTELVSKNDFEDIWKVRTRLTQGSDEMMLEADCTDYIASLSALLEGKMTLTASTWSDIGGSIANFEDSIFCKKDLASCDAAVSSISDIKIYEDANNEEPMDESNVKPLIGDSDYRTAGFEFFANGIEDKFIETIDRGLYIGENNRAFILEADDESVESVYLHPYLGGTVSF